MALTRFQTKELEVVGGTAIARSNVVSQDETVNLYPVIVDAEKGQFYLDSFPGSVKLSQGTGVDRGLGVFNNVLYQVQDQTLYSIDEAGVRTNVGNIPGFDRCIFTATNELLIITTGAGGFGFDGTTVSQNTDPDYEPSNSSAFLNNQVIYDGQEGRFQVSEVGEPFNMNPLNYGTAEASPDVMKRVYVFKDIVYLFGEKSIEFWYNSGAGDPPFDRYQGTTFTFGLQAIHAVANSEDFLYFLGTDNRVYRCSQYQPEQISTSSISAQINNLSITSDAVGSVFKFEGQTFFVLNFPMGNKCFVYSETANTWFTLEDGIERQTSKIKSVIEIYQKVLWSDSQGNVYYLDRNTFTNNNEPFLRLRQFQAVSNTQLGLPGRRVLMNKVGVGCDIGNGLLSGQGEIPKAVFQFSLDGGKSWTQEQFVDLGRLGETVGKVECYLLLSFYTLNIRVFLTDPVYFNLNSLFLEFRETGY